MLWKTRWICQITRTEWNTVFQAEVGTKDNVEVLVDGNNVDIENENLELYSAYIQQAATIQKMNSVISDYRYVLTNASFK